MGEIIRMKHQHTVWWICQNTIIDAELEEELQALELRTNRREREQMQRLMCRLNGDYAEEDFEAYSSFVNAAELRVHRNNQQQSFLIKLGFLNNDSVI